MQRNCSLFILKQPQKPEDIKGKLCLVTGGGYGLGRCLAMKFAQEGCNIAIVDILNSENTVKEIKSRYDVKCQSFMYDISDNDAITEMKVKVEAEMGEVDILVNNAGVLFMAPFLNSTKTSGNVSMLTCLHISLYGMITRKSGRIVAVSSMTARLTLPLSTVYAATKFGVDGFMETLYDDLCIDDYDKFIKLSTIFPFFINTRKEIQNTMDEIGDIIPRLTPEYVAEKSVEGILINKRNIFITPDYAHFIVNNLPDRVRRHLKTSVGATKEYKQKHFN
ncbi:CLUMA_CG002381, isoform A [Clunio marinus]|uniref:CLUMA_CG002381, isoform A n=1 Tax=Clunio marinus TaxID=568069 RepID=A0A1J1HQX4_9DIPT|nr:CLUMA_CG002381, isoform A [Clunio marinus]